jgi:hypothetical protein
MNQVELDNAALDVEMIELLLPELPSLYRKVGFKAGNENLS